MDIVESRGVTFMAITVTIACTRTTGITMALPTTIEERHKAPHIRCIVEASMTQAKTRFLNTRRINPIIKPSQATAATLAVSGAQGRPGRRQSGSFASVFSASRRDVSS